MSKKPIERETHFRPDPNRRHRPIDRDVKLPYQVRCGAAIANALSSGQPVVPVSEPKKEADPNQKSA
jgi:hypothetical protein